MKTNISFKNNINSLEKLQILLNKESSYKCSIEYDIWEIRTDEKGQMKQCLVFKKNNFHAVKLFFIDDFTANVSYIIPNKLLNNYFGRSTKTNRNIIEVITDAIKQSILAVPQQKAFEELVEKIKLRSN